MTSESPYLAKIIPHKGKICHDAELPVNGIMYMDSRETVMDEI